MKKFFWIIGLLCMFTTTATSAEGKGVTYHFDDVRVNYASEFTIYPAFERHNDKGTINQPPVWLQEVVSSFEEPIEVMYGHVSLLQEGTEIVQEQFIKVSGDHGSERFLVNSASYTYNEFTGHLTEAYLIFWSAKKLEGHDVVKSFSEPLKVIQLHQIFDEYGDIVSIFVYFDDKPYGMVNTPISPYSYIADVHSINTTGKLTK